MKNLSEKSLLVNLRIAQWTARKYDRKITDEVNASHNSKDAGRFNKLLIAKENLQAIGQVVSKARTFHYENTLPWSDSGERLLPSTNYFEYVGKLAELKNEFETCVNKFIADYPDMVAQAKVDLNGLFNQNDYPNDIAHKFGIKTTFMPVPDIQDIRVNLSENEVNNIRESLESELSDRFASAQKSIYERVIEQLKYMHERLSEKDSIFRDSLFENVLSLVDLLPRLNVSNDPKIEQMCQELNALYVDPANVRKDVNLRATKAQEVEAMLNKFNSFLA